MSSLERGPLFPQPNDAWVARRAGALAGEFRRERRRQARQRALAGGAVVAIALAGALVGLLGKGGPQSAYAGWTAVPTTPTPAQVRAAEGRLACNVGGAPAAIGPIVTDGRGPFISLAFESRTEAMLCISRPGVWTAKSGGPLPPRLAPEQVIDLGAGLATPVGGSTISYVGAHVGSAVTALTVTLSDGRRVALTVSRGWAIGWWPGISYIVTGRVTTANRTFTVRAPRPLWLEHHCASLRLAHLPFACPTAKPGR
jgi:hypothetical protein